MASATEERSQSAWRWGWQSVSALAPAAPLRWRLESPSGSRVALTSRSLLASLSLWAERVAFAVLVHYENAGLAGIILVSLESDLALVIQVRIAVPIIKGTTGSRQNRRGHSITANAPKVETAFSDVVDRILGPSERDRAGAIDCG